MSVRSGHAKTTQGIMIRTMGRAGVAAWVGAAAICCAAAEPKTHFEIDGTRRWPISPYIYGTNQPDWQGRSKHLTLARWGGNRITAYNWETNASNAGSDWQHQNDGWLDPNDVPGNPVRKLVAAAHGAGASAIVTVPILGYVAADKAGGGDVGKTPGYLESRFLPSFARKRAGICDPPDLVDGRVFQDEFVCWLERAFPDARRDPALGWRVYSHGGRIPLELETLAWAHRVESLGAGEILLTSMDCDGTGEGYDLELTGAVSRALTIPVIASGGCGTPEHIHDVFALAGADAALAASIFHYRRNSIPEVKRYLAGRQIPVRL
jgi:hypothetical protein